MLRAGMKRAIFFLFFPLWAWGEVESNIPLGVEAVTGYRTELVHRGFVVAEDVFDFQVETEIVLADEWSVAIGGLYGTGSVHQSNEDFSETFGFVELRYGAKEWIAGWFVGYRNFSGSMLGDGWETGPFFTWHWNDDLDTTARILHDEAADSLFATLDASWSKALDEKSFIVVKGGVSVVDDFYGSKGFHAAELRVSYTYLVAPNVSFTPFVGTSLGIDDAADDSVYGGLWFEVTF
jgi:hypothetical protein